IYFDLWAINDVEFVSNDAVIRYVGFSSVNEIKKMSEEQYTSLITQLEEQITLCTTIAAHYLRSGNKNQAIAFLRYKKGFSADLTSLKSYQKHNKDIPPFHYRDVTYNIENAFLELSANDMEVCIERAWTLGNKEVNGKDVEAYVSWDIGWPTEGSSGAGSGKGDTSVAKRSMDPEFNYKKIISIERTKSFQRFISRKKATFEVFHYRGFLRRAISLGKAQLKLDSLTGKAEIHEVLDLVDNNRRSTGGKLEVRLRLRNPLLKADIIQKTEKWLVVHGFNLNNPIANTQVSVPSPEVTPVKSNSVTSQSDPLGLSTVSDPSTPIKQTLNKSSTPSVKKTSSTVANTPSQVHNTPTLVHNTVANTQTQVHNTVANTPTQVHNTVANTPTQVHNKLPSQVTTPVSKPNPSVTNSKDTQTTSIEENELELAEDQLNNVDLIVSSGLLQEEINIVNSQITTLEARGKPIPGDLSDRKSALEIKTSLMEIQVQTGQLTIDKYLEQVKDSIVSFKKLALTFKKAGKIEEAKKALVKCKVMENEVKQMEEAMAGGETDDN
ncbi:14725_t:CDS:2, partial [Cetraspora pellucida]